MPKKTKTKESEVAPMLAVVHGKTYLHSSVPSEDETKNFLGARGKGVEYFKILIVKKIRSKGSYSVFKFGENIVGIHQHLSSFSEEEFADLLPKDEELKEKMIKVRGNKQGFLAYEDLVELMKIYTASLMGNGEYSFLGTLWHLHKVFDQKITRIKTKELTRKES